MTPGGGKPATPEQVARFGHVAAALRAYLKTANLKPADFNQEMGVDRANPKLYHWLNAKGAPSKGSRAKIAKLTGIPEVELMSRSIGEIARTALPVATTKLPAVVTTPGAKRPEVLAFVVDDEGRARIKLDVTLPIEDGAPLLRLLLDQGLVMRRAASDE
jgi:hypothetical protein